MNCGPRWGGTRQARWRDGIASCSASALPTWTDTSMHTRALLSRVRMPGVRAMDELSAVEVHFRAPRKTLDCLHSLAGEGVRWVVLVENSEAGGASLHVMQ